MTQILTIDDLVDMRLYLDEAPLEIDMVYAKKHHPENIFGCALYRIDAPFFLHKDLAKITLNAAKSLHSDFGWISILMDGLRPIEAQAAMQETAIVKANPHWCQEPNRLLSPPGHGGHPRGMAVDIVCIDDEGGRIDMGTAFDHLSEDPDYNPAARSFTDLPADVLENRVRLEQAMVKAAENLNLPLLPLPAEWWDFRFPKNLYEQYAPLSDQDLPENQRICLKFI